MKILIPIMGFTRSGGMRVLSRLSSELIALGHKVDFLAPHTHAVPYHPTSATTIKYNFRTSRYKVINFLLKKIALFNELSKISHSYDVVLGNHNSTAFPVWLATRRKKNGCYYIQAYEPEMCTKTITGLLAALMGRLTYKLDLLRIVNSPIYLSYKEIRAKHIVEPGIDTSIFKPGPQKSKGISDTIIIGCIGRKESWKGTNEIIEAVQIIREKIKKETSRNLILHLAFEVPERYAHSNRPDFIKIYEPHGDEALASFYQNVDIVIATGLIQSGAFHYPCLEGLACGKIVISNYAPATAENAILLDEVTVPRIVAALERACCNLDRPISFDSNAYSWDHVGQKMESILTKSFPHK